MANIKQALELYTLMAQRCEKGGVAKNQARVYREMIEYMKGCNTVEEAQEKIKNSDYYLAPSIALVQDKIVTLMEAAKENHMDDVVKIYEKKLVEIEKDRSAIYEAGYLVTAQNAKIKYVETYTAFSNIYNAYLRLRCCVSNDDVEIHDALESLRQGFNDLEAPSHDFIVLSQLKQFRSLIQCDDKAYKHFIEEALVLRDVGIDYQDELDIVMREAKEAWEAVNTSKDDIIKVGKENSVLVKKGRIIVIAPKDKDGTYTFIDEEVH